MRNPNYSSIDAKGNLTFNGQLEITKGNHDHMPSRTAAYQAGDERGHVNASSLGGVNDKTNVAPQHKDLNHGAYYAMEQGERNALTNQASIQSSKTAFVDSVPGNRPSAFIVSDTITYADGHTEKVNLSFTNVSNAEQESWNQQSAAVLGEINDPNPGDGLRASMSAEQYAALMEETDASLPNIAEEYTPTVSVESDLAMFDAAQQNASELDTDVGSTASLSAGNETDISSSLGNDNSISDDGGISL